MRARSHLIDNILIFHQQISRFLNLSILFNHIKFIELDDLCIWAYKSFICFENFQMKSYHFCSLAQKGEQTAYSNALYINNTPFIDANTFWSPTITIMNNRSQLCLITKCNDKLKRTGNQPKVVKYQYYI